MPSLREQAIAPDQYDNPAMNWAAEGGADTPVRRFMCEYIEPVLASVTPNRLLDVGCGTAWLSQIAETYGAQRYVGIDPSITNVNHAHQLYPDVGVWQSSTETFVAEEKFDLITCIMATEHIDSLDTAFYKWKGLLDDEGKILVIAGNTEAFSVPKFDYTLRVEPIDENEFVVETIRPSSPASTTDIIRSVGKFAASATLSGLAMLQNIPMPATESFIAASPKYELFRNKPIFQLMIFGAK